MGMNLEIHSFTGVSAWHAAGYTGSRVSAATGEVLVPSDWRGSGHVESLINKGERETPEHSFLTASVFFEVAPDATLYRASNHSRRNPDGTYTYDLYDLLMPEMERIGITLMFTSQSHGVGANELKRAAEFYEDNDWFIPFWAAGNEGDESANPVLRLTETVGVAAYAVKDGQAVPKYYSSESPLVDFAAPTDIYYMDGSLRRMGTGTSAATPYLCGMAALVQDLFIAKTGRPLKRAALLRFFRDNCVDLNEPGHDEKTGYGAVILPPPESINVWDYQEGGITMDVKAFADYDQIPVWARDAVQTMLDRGIMEGVGDNRFAPLAGVNRAQLATALARLLEEVEKP